MVRPAEADDIPRMAELADLKRTKYKRFSPTFWRKAEGAVQGQMEFFQDLLERRDVTAPVWDEGEVEGFIISSVVPPPPVYAPGENVCVVDDFVVSSPEAWLTVGNRPTERGGRTGQGTGGEPVGRHLRSSRRAEAGDAPRKRFRRHVRVVRQPRIGV